VKAPLAFWILVSTSLRVPPSSGTLLPMYVKSTCQIRRVLYLEQSRWIVTEFSIHNRHIAYLHRIRCVLKRKPSLYVHCFVFCNFKTCSIRWRRKTVETYKTGSPETMFRRLWNHAWGFTASQTSRLWLCLQDNNIISLVNQLSFRVIMRNAKRTDRTTYPPDQQYVLQQEGDLCSLRRFMACRPTK
jgi:hypothetical protein